MKISNNNSNFPHTSNCASKLNYTGGNFGTIDVEAEKFISNFHKHMFGSESYYWSKQLNQNAMKQRYLEFMNEIHIKQFQGKEKLNQGERCHFMHRIAHHSCIDSRENGPKPCKATFLMREDLRPNLPPKLQKKCYF